MYQTLHSHHNHYIPRAASIRGLLDHPFAHLQTSIYTCIPRLFYPFPHLWRSADYPHLRLSADNPYAILSLKIISSDSHSTSFAESIEWASFHCTYDRRWVSEHAHLLERASATFYLHEQAFVSPSWTHTASFLGKRATCTGIIISLSKSSSSEPLLHSADLASISWHKIKVMIWLWKLLSGMIYWWWMLQQRSNAIVIIVANIRWLILLQS